MSCGEGQDAAETAPDAAPDQSPPAPAPQRSAAPAGGGGTLIGTMASQDEIAAAIKALSFKDADDEELAYASHQQLSTERRHIMATVFPDLAAGLAVDAYSVTAKRGDNLREFVALVKQGTSPPQVSLVIGSCGITFEDLVPAECVEYAFAETPDQWRMAQLSLEALETYRGMKFEAWRKMLLEPTCEAQFRRMLQIGAITEMYDPQVFPTPETLKDKYHVTDDRTGKLIQLPHPVGALRRWDAKSQAYTPVESHLGGAPAQAEAGAWWNGFVAELSVQHGAEYVTGLMATSS